MLERLNTIDWANVRAMFGSGVHLPDAIRDLGSADADVREAAVERLDNSVVVQGALTDAAAVIVPFLTEIVAEPGAHGKSESLDLLFELARGYPRVRADSEAAQAWATREGIDLAEAASLAEEEARSTRRALLEGVSTYCDALSAPEPEVRLGAAYLLSELPEARDAAEEPLLAACECEIEPAHRAVLIQCFGELFEGTGRGSERLEQLMSHAMSDVDRTAAAAALALVMREKTPVNAVEVLVRAMRISWSSPRPGPTAALTVRFPLRSLCALGAPRGTDALIQCLNGPRGSREAHRIAEALLALAFGERAYVVHSEHRSGAVARIEYRSKEELGSHARTFSELQRRVITAVVQCDEVWGIDSNLLEMFGLPSTRSELGALLESN
jgi:hypothetical protein